VGMYEFDRRLAFIKPRVTPSGCTGKKNAVA
jgi:hypothetical protein